MKVAARKLSGLSIEISRHVGKAADTARAWKTLATGGETTHENVVLTGTRSGGGDIRKISQEIVERGDVELSDRLSGQYLDRDRYVLNRFFAALGGNGDLADFVCGSRRRCSVSGLSVCRSGGVSRENR